MNKTKILVIGNGMVGHHFVETLANSDADVEITVLGGETVPAYDRVHLSEVFDGKEPSDLAMTTTEYYDTLQVKYHFGDFVTELDRESKQVTTESGAVFQYDKLVLATGSYAFIPPIQGNDLEHCLAYRTLEDLDAIKASARDAKTGVVVGGGLLGLECANALKNLGLEAHVVEFAPGLMGVQLDQDGSSMLRRKIEALGVKVHTSKATQTITAGDQSRLKMSFADGGELETDLIVFSAGIRPYDQLARDAGLELGARGGVKVNEYCMSSDENILAIGECASYQDFIYGLVAPGYRMAETAVSQIVDNSRSFAGADMSTKLKLLGVDVGSIGDAHAQAAGAKAYVFNDEPNQIYKKIVVNSEGTRLTGAILVGDTETYDVMLQLYLNDMDIPENPVSLLIPDAGDPMVGIGVDNLPDSAQVCSCHNVTKLDICSAIADGACSMAQLKSCTKAGTGCGGCAALTTSVLNNELEKQGISVDKSICEHFPYTRQELYHLVRVEKIASFDDMLAKHGKGLGCAICKPTLASIFASCWNQYILDGKNQGLQDTNDRMLANMQKNGTYSIVPRIPAGEITPDKLIVLGQVAKKYNLYTKITGGMRIDLFGATSEQLPLVWAELIAAGFETGHAYGKSVRTVKACVGSTWCRYGVLDSMSNAINIENRYKGLRSPHKLKFAVSGCTRECAEAQSKDVGVIATELGWSLYVCGNGGMRPRHADLLATGLDDETLIKYIDRFLMFYIKTADKLQRTSVWLENLEGGLDYLKEVVCEDSLGIAETLEAQMQLVVDNYQCEWKTSLKDPVKVNTFMPFINSPVKDSSIVFVNERDQIRPAEENELVKLSHKEEMEA
ncbi:MAG: nitrite reductase large subunit [Gammaproteobacteria bacterium]|nr:nitrite reductase large subunit NirB [Gammaproteobacteria bacterium]NNC96642.1 nitrite reductase large subunit [Gammaproteobacteria bacterium]NNM13464.1 nitrite reductase large subunit [Gammaproteobacteria bacterium]